MDPYSDGKTEPGAVGDWASGVGRLANWLMFPVAVGAIVNVVAGAVFALIYAFSGPRAAFWTTVLAVASVAISAIAKLVEERSR